jgi:penicillin amidase
MNLPDGYPYQERKLGFDGWSSPFRYQRIAEVLNSASKVTIEDMLKLKNDYLSIPARRIIGSLGGLNSTDPKVSTALNMLRSWDYYLNADSAAAAIFQRWWSRLRTAIVAKMVDVPPAARSTVGGSDPRLILELVENPDSRLGPDPVTARNDAILSSLALAIVSLEGDLGPNMETWTYGAIHSRSYEHALSDFVDEETRELIDVGPPFARGGGGDSVGADGATWAMIVDVGHWDHSIAINTPGQSGDPYSPHYRDLFPIWAQNQVFPLLYTFGRIQGETEQTIRLEPWKH